MKIPVPKLPEFEDYDLGLSQQTHFETFWIYVPWIPFEDRAGLPIEYQIYGRHTPMESEPFSTLDLTQYLEGGAIAGLASITGPQTVDTQGWLPVGEKLPYTVNFANSPDASRHLQEVRVVTQFDEDR